MRIAAVILAAGASTRLGRPKQLLVLDKENLLERAVRIASEVCDPVIVVLGAHAQSIRSVCDLGAATVVVNEGWRDGMGSSIRTGLQALENAEGAIFLTCDMPGVTADHLGRLSESGALTASFYAGRCGVPAYFPASCFEELLQLRGEGGARDLLRSAAAVELAGGHLDIDTIDDFEAANALWQLNSR